MRSRLSLAALLGCSLVGALPALSSRRPPRRNEMVTRRALESLLDVSKMPRGVARTTPLTEPNTWRGSSTRPQF